MLAIVLAFWHGVKLRQQLETVNRLATSLQTVETQLTGEVAGGLQEIRDALPMLGAIEKQLTEQIGRSVQEIREALPTQRLGRFPSFLPAIVDRILAATHSVAIFCDFPAYGSFSDPETFRRYHRALEDKIGDRIPVTIACLGENARAEDFREQERKDSEGWKAYKERRRADFEKYLEFHSYPETIDDLTNDAFIDYIIAEDNRAASQYYHGAKLLDVFTRPTVYFWLIDDDTMIFVIPSATRLDEYGFYTQDSHLIASLKEVAGACSPLFRAVESRAVPQAPAG